MGNQKTERAIARRKWTALVPIVALAAAVMLPTQVAAQSRLQAGTLACKGDGGWGAIIGSRKRFQCTFAGSKGKVKGEYSGVVSKLGIDIGKTGATSLVWLVFGPTNMVGDNYNPGSLEGSYVGVGAEATVGLGLGANVLVGGGADSFALQPVSVQVQTGLSIAAGVQSLNLKYVGPLN